MQSQWAMIHLVHRDITNTSAAPSGEVKEVRSIQQR